MRPAPEATEDRVALSETFRQVAPRATDAVDLRGRINELTVVTSGNAAVSQLSGKQMLNPGKLLVGDFVSFHSNGVVQIDVFAGVCSTATSKSIVHTL
jgi:hypothetical protein